MEKATILSIEDIQKLDRTPIFVTGLPPYKFKAWYLVDMSTGRPEIFNKTGIIELNKENYGINGYMIGWTSKPNEEQLYELKIEK